MMTLSITKLDADNRYADCLFAQMCFSHRLGHYSQFLNLAEKACRAQYTLGFAPIKHFQPNLIFENSRGAKISGAHYKAHSGRKQAPLLKRKN